MAYSWKFYEVLQLLNVKFNPNRKEQKIKCVYCGQNSFGANLELGVGRCFECKKTADSAMYYSIATGLSISDARKDIENRLGITGKGEREIPPRIVFNTQHKEEDIKASDDVLDDTYRAFLAELTLSDKNKFMLIARGLTEKEIEALGYKTFPRRDEIDYFALCRRLQANGHVLKGVPGFFKTIKGDYTFIQLTKGIIMPQVNYKNQITALQIRKDDDLRVFIEEEGKYEKKCGWFSSKNRDGGMSSNAPVHYACDFKYNTDKEQFEPVFTNGFAITEGIMKGDIAHFIQPNLPFLCVPGVDVINYLKTELERLKSWGVSVIMLCYDMDYKTNSNVQDALNKTETMITEMGFKLKRAEWDTKILIENQEKDLLKGIDDYLAYVKYKIIPEVKKK